MNITILVIVKFVILWKVIFDETNRLRTSIYEVYGICHRVSLSTFFQVLNLVDMLSEQFKVVDVKLCEEIHSVSVEDKDHIVGR